MMRQLCGCVLFSTARDDFTDARTGEQDQTDRSHDDELHRVPQAQENEKVEPSRAAVCDESGEGARRKEVGHGKEHRGHAPLQTSPGADGVEEDVGGYVAPQECAGVDAKGPELADHGGVSSHMHDG